jgi:hypothetical protein
MLPGATADQQDEQRTENQTAGQGSAAQGEAHAMTSGGGREQLGPEVRVRNEEKGLRTEGTAARVGIVCLE